MSQPRELNPAAFFQLLARSRQPRMRFAGQTQADFETWQAQTLPQVLATVGRRPDAVPPDAQCLVRWEEDGLIKERWLINTQPGLSAHLLVFRPADLKPDQRLPAIFCAHGHGLGQDEVMGIAMQGDRSEANAIAHNAYGLVMAQKGFVTYGIDWLGFGRRDAARKPHDLAKYGKRDPCNVHFLCAIMLGTTPMAINLRDARAATDFITQQPYVDQSKIGVMGFSYGGTMATWLALDDPRYQAVDIICYAGPFKEIAYDTYNVCGSQITPGLYELVDTFDLQGLIAPRPLLLELGVADGCFSIDHTHHDHYKPLEKIYRAAAASQQLQLDLFPGGHGWGANHSEAFFRKHLQTD